MHIPLHVSALFIALVFAVAFIILITVYASSNRLNLPGRKKGQYFIATCTGILIWLTFTFIISLIGITRLLPLPLLLAVTVLPPMLILCALFFTNAFNRLVSAIDVHWLIYLQSFRILRELIFLMLYRYHAAPADITLAGRNFDILIGLTAPLVAWYYFKQKKGAVTIATIWNIAGVAGTINLLVMLLSNGNGVYQLLFSFPYIWSPAFSLPVSLFLHVIALKKLLGANSKPVFT